MLPWDNTASEGISSSAKSRSRWLASSDTELILDAAVNHISINSSYYNYKSKREKLGIDDIISVLQPNRLWWYGHVWWKDDDDWVKKCMEYEVEGPRSRGRPQQRGPGEENDCQTWKLNKEDAMDHRRWRKLIKDVWWTGWVWVDECFLVVAYQGSPGQRAIKWLCVSHNKKLCYCRQTTWCAISAEILLAATQLKEQVEQKMSEL